MRYTSPAPNLVDALTHGSDRARHYVCILAPRVLEEMMSIAARTPGECMRGGLPLHNPTICPGGELHQPCGSESPRVQYTHVMVFWSNSFFFFFFFRHHGAHLHRRL